MSAVSAASQARVSLRFGPPLMWWRLLTGALGRPADWHPQYPLTETLVAAALTLEARQADHDRPDWDGDPWGLYQIVSDATVVGDAGFHGPPAPEPPYAVEIGYDVVPARRREGIASAACRELLVIAWRAGADLVRAETEAENLASRRVLLNTGFHLTPDGSFLIRRPEQPRD
jgi:RimJ/RimL family protein N-acetyltransferase